MAFCGQCGLLLNPDAIKCPRCGTVTEFDVVSPSSSDNDATIMAHTNEGQMKEIPFTPPPQSEQTSTPNYPGQRGNYSAAAGSTEAAYPAQSVPNYPPHAEPQPRSYGGNTYATPRGVSQPSMYPFTEPGYPSQPPVPPRKTWRLPLILVALLLLVLVTGTAAFFILGPAHFPLLFGGRNVATVVPATQPPAPTQSQSTPTAQPSPTAAQPSAAQQAQSAVQQYFTDINNKDYQGAYNLWVNDPQTYTQFQQGFAHTQRDDITFGDALLQSDGSIRVNVTIKSTEDAASGAGTQISTYQGYYLMGQQSSGGWKIVTASINRV